MTQERNTPAALPVVDARGLSCPLPVLRLRKRLSLLADGAAVELLATDRAALKDVPAFCAAQGHRVVSAHEDTDRVLRFHILKSPD